VNTALTSGDLELLRGDNYAWIVTLNADGTPAASVTWIDATETHVLVNTAVGRRKDHNVRRDPRVTVALQRHGDAYRWVSIEGFVEHREIGLEAEAHIDVLCRRYDGEPWTPVEGQERVRWHVRPTRIVRYGE
jgi:PPOX class probable F420-dependent enzyme